MDATMSVKGWYGFVGLGQMGGNVVKSIHVKGCPVMAANTAQSDLDGLDIPEEYKYHILGGYGSSKERKKAKQLLAENNCENFNLLINEIKERFKECHVIFLMGSSGGGSGSAMVPATKSACKKHGKRLGFYTKITKAVNSRNADSFAHICLPQYSASTCYQQNN